MNARRWLPTAAAGAALLAPAAALAHDSVAAGGDVFQQGAVSLAVVLGLMVAYAVGTGRFWHRAGRRRRYGLRITHAALFLTGVAALAAAVFGPLDAAAGRSLSAHMAQHMVLAVAAPALLAAGRLDLALLWAAGKPLRRTLAAGLAHRISAPAIWVTRPVPAALVHSLALWLWHVPALFDAAVASPALHLLEHAAFFGTALLFWQAILRARRGTEVAQALLATLIVLVTGGFLGALLAFAPVPLFSAYAGASPLFGLTLLADQQLAGLLMWVPAGAALIVTGVGLAIRLLHDAPAGRAGTIVETSRLAQR